MNILAIGNSFSTDATRYLHQIAKSDNCNLTVVNLYIGGCPLSRHYKNMLTDSKSYSLEFNGASTGFYVSIKEALLSRDWDFITMQQVSHMSPDFETYTPYLEELSAYVKKYTPKAKQIIHQTWAYEENSARLTTEMGYNHHFEMFEDIKTAYKKAAKEIDAKLIIPSGELINTLYQNGMTSLQRDTYHASYGIGRYALGLLWYACLVQKDVENISFNDFDEPVSTKDIKTVKKIVSRIVFDK